MNFPMQVNFRIPEFQSTGASLVKVRDRVFIITFLPGSKWNMFRICVDGKLSNQSVNCLNFNTSKKDIYLKAIQYVHYSGKRTDTPRPSKLMTVEKAKQMYAKWVVKSMQANLLTVETEQSRDVLQYYNLVFICTSNL